MSTPLHPELIFFDIDDTLCRVGKLAQNNYHTLKELHAHDIRLGIATGRSVCMIPPSLRPVLEEGLIDVLVSTNGQYNLIGDAVASHYPLPNRDVKRLIEVIEHFQLDYQQASPDHIAWSRKQPHYHQVVADYPAFVIDPEYYRKHTIYQLSVFLPESQEHAPVRDAFAEIGYVLARWHKGGADIIPKAGSKARGIADVCNALSIAVENTMAFGDGLNDMEMLAFVGTGVAMGDGWPKLHAIADYVTGNIEEDGIRNALVHFGVLPK